MKVSTGSWAVLVVTAAIRCQVNTSHALRFIQGFDIQGGATNSVIAAITQVHFLHHRVSTAGADFRTASGFKLRFRVLIPAESGKLIRRTSRLVHPRHDILARAPKTLDVINAGEVRVFIRKAIPLVGR